ncbi:MAG: hypothetical protein GX882_07735 [Methanomicrobiales archaeon]|nr:hypothetical protein [Methanomicrobiales archaeon]
MIWSASSRIGPPNLRDRLIHHEEIPGWQEYWRPHTARKPGEVPMDLWNWSISPVGRREWRWGDTWTDPDPLKQPSSRAGQTTHLPQA